MLLKRYCRTSIESDLKDEYAKATAPNASREAVRDFIVKRLKKAFYSGTWVACNKTKYNERCFKVFESILRGDLFPSNPNTTNTDLETLYNGRLYLGIDTDVSDSYAGGVEQRECEWVKNGISQGSPFDCFTFDIESPQVQGYWFNHCTRGIACSESHLGILDHPDKNHRQTLKRIYDRSPLAYPFISFTESGQRYMVFLSDDTNYGVDIFAKVPVDSNPRVVFAQGSDGWWKTPVTDAASPDRNDPVVRLVGDTTDG